jgi:transposase
MPDAYSADLRKRVLRACRREDGTRQQIARRFQVSESTVYGWQKVERDDGRREAKPPAGGPAALIDDAGERVLRALVATDTDATLAEYAQAFAAKTGKVVSVPVVCRALKRMNLRRKKRHCGPVNVSGRMSPPNGTPGRTG